MPYTPLQGSFEKARRAEAAGRLRGYRRRLRQFKEDPHRGRTATAAAGTTLAKDHALAAIRQDLRAGERHREGGGRPQPRRPAVPSWAKRSPGSKAARGCRRRSSMTSSTW